MDTPSEEITLDKLCFTSLLEKGSTLKGENLLPLGANSLLLEWTSFQKGFAVWETKQEVTGLFPLLKLCQVYPVTLTCAKTEQI